jgi:hypothetical protein
MSLHLALPVAALAVVAQSFAVTTAQAADWRRIEPRPARTLTISKLVPDVQGGLWAFDDNSVRHLDASGQSSVADRVLVRAGSRKLAFGDGLALADGGAIVFSRSFGPPCRIGRVDAQSRLLWSRDEPDGCHRIATNADGVVWKAAGTQLVRIGRDGSTRAQVDLSSFGSVRAMALAVDAAGGAVVAVRDPQDNNRFTQVASYTSDGQQRWTRNWGSPTVNEIRILANGDVIAAGIGIAGFRGPLQITALSPDGTQRWRSNVDGTGSASQAQLFADADGLTAVGNDPADTTSGTTTVVRLTHEGSVRWQASPCSRRFDQAAGSPAGDIAIACLDPTLGIRRWNKDGVESFLKTVPWTFVTDLDFGPHDTLVATGFANPAPSGGDISALAFDAAGNATPAPLEGTTQPDIGAALAQYVAPDGTTYIASRSGVTYESRGERLSKIDPQGNVLWTREISDRLDSTYSIVARADRVCATGRFLQTPMPALQINWKILCFDATSGEILWEEGATTTRPRAFAGMLDDGRVFVVFGIDDKFQIMRIDRNGRMQLSSAVDGIPVFATIEGSGRTTVVTARTSPPALAFHRYDANGTTVYSASASTTGATPTAFAVAPDGTSYLLAATTNAGELYAIAADGTTRWRKDVPFSTGNFFPFGNLFATRDAVYLYQNSSAPAGNATSDTSWLSRIAPADGAIVWRRSTSHPIVRETAGTAAIDDAGDTLTVATTFENRLRVETVATATGRTLQDRTIDCGRACVAPTGVGLGRDGFARVAATAIDTQTGQAAVLFGVDMTTPAPIRVDQPGIAGGWWSPYANGEGFVLDYLPDSRTLFMPWFTFSHEGGNEPAGQRWYVVQGAAQANATEVELPITETTGGAFDAGPAVTPTIVGTATLSFTDCDNGTLRYRFDAGHNDGATGAITLSRLSPATQNCILADGSTQTRTVAPANGFDARMSGSWFEPATSGQGMQLTVQPGGIFFAPWFTFDPAGASDDPGKQRWFTIQGSLADARNGVATLPIVQTIGGAFDSVPTNNMYAVGSATITMLACDRAKVDYRFDDNELAAAMRNRSGSVDLVKAGGCMR